MNTSYDFFFIDTRVDLLSFFGGDDWKLGCIK